MKPVGDYVLCMDRMAGHVAEVARLPSYQNPFTAVFSPSFRSSLEIAVAESNRLLADIMRHRGPNSRLGRYSSVVIGDVVFLRSLREVMGPEQAINLLPVGGHLTEGGLLILDEGSSVLPLAMDHPVAVEGIEGGMPFRGVVEQVAARQRGARLVMSLHDPWGRVHAYTARAFRQAHGIRDLFALALAVGAWQLFFNRTAQS